jgi:hypothetical protein
MRSVEGDLSRVLLIVAAAVTAACSGHLTKLPVQEVPIESVQAPPTPLVDESAPAAEEPGGAGATSAGSATATTGAAASSRGPVALPAVASATDDSAGANEGDPKIAAAMKLMKTGKKTDLFAARRLLSATVLVGAGTPDQARLLRLICSKLNDKTCVAKCAAYIR